MRFNIKGVEKMSENTLEKRDNRYMLYIRKVIKSNPTAGFK